MNREIENFSYHGTEGLRSLSSDFVVSPAPAVSPEFLATFSRSGARQHSTQAAWKATTQHRPSPASVRPTIRALQSAPPLSPPSSSLSSPCTPASSGAEERCSGSCQRLPIAEPARRASPGDARLRRGHPVTFSLSRSHPNMRISSGSLFYANVVQRQIAAWQQARESEDSPDSRF